jgi:hypothetical protein
MYSAYWCVPCRVWWDAQLKGWERERLRHWLWNGKAPSAGRPRYGQRHCPCCGLETRSWAPTQIERGCGVPVILAPPRPAHGIGMGEPTEGVGDRSITS